jgi:hypothetical protein
LLPLLQLSALTKLQVCAAGTGKGATALVGVAAQLTQLKELEIGGFPQTLTVWTTQLLADPVLLQLTSPTALQQLTWSGRLYGHHCLRNKVGACQSCCGAVYACMLTVMLSKSLMHVRL